MKTLVLTLSCVALAMGQAPAPDWKTTSSSARTMHNTVKQNVLRSAEKMPEEHYSFKPAPEVRSFGQMVGHIADASNNYCAGSLGTANPNPGIEKGKTSKADLVAALKSAMDLCDKAYDITDAQGGETVKYRNQERNRVGMLYYNAFHNNLHYGNLVTYLRLKGIVPPSTDR